MTGDDVARALAELDRFGILLLQDPRLPSLATLLANERVRGSWWGHPAGKRIFAAAGALEEHRDVAAFKLIAAKVCFVHRRFWPALAAIGGAREPWQLDRLDGEARALLERVDREGRVRASGKAAKSLEVRLLAAGQQVHTGSGAHASELSSWGRFATDRGVRAMRSVDGAKQTIEATVAAMAEASGGRAPVPWRAR